MTTSLPAADDFDVAIIGGGAAGVLVAIHLLATRTAPSRIAIVEPRPALAEGAAYSTPYPEHLLNVIASRMSAFPDDPGHFVRHLEAQAAGSGAGDETPVAQRFARRSDFARYLQATLAAMPGAGDVQWVRDEAIDLERSAGWSIRLASGGSLSARAVVLALGNFVRTLPLSRAAIHGDPALTNAWDYAAIERIGPDDDVCIVGSGLSMVDTVASLAARGHRGNITVLSRHGLVPLAHAAPGVQESDIGGLAALGLRQRMRAIRRQAAAGMRAGEPWQWTMDRLRHHVQALWTSLPPVEQRRFLRHAARFWDIHRHRIAPSVSARIQALRASGRLALHAAHLVSIARQANGIHVRFRPRGASTETSIRVDHVVNGTGMELNIDRMQSRLVAAMNQRALLAAGPHGIGIATDEAGAIVLADGTVAPDLMTLGGLRAGQLWESIAIPELRDQARQVARMLTPVPTQRTAALQK